MTTMFQECKELEYLDLSNFNTSNVINMSYMFFGCHKLKEIKGINEFNMAKITDVEGMFDGCGKLENLDISKLNIPNSININHKKSIIHQLNKEKEKNIQLENELDLERKKVEKLEKASEEIIAVDFRSSDQIINYPISGKNADKFSTLEEKLYKEFPELKDKNIFFLANGNILKKELTLEQNKIKAGIIIIIQDNSEKT